MYNLADEGVQFSPTQLFNQTRRGCSASNGQGVQLGRYIQSAAAGILWERGVIAEAAMKNGYLKMPQEEARIKVLGATLTV